MAFFIRRQSGSLDKYLAEQKGIKNGALYLDCL